MGQPVVLPKFELQGDKPHWAVRAAWITGGLLLISLVGLGAIIFHHRNLETQAHIAKAEAIARVKAEAEAKVAVIAAKAKAQREAELEAKVAAQRLPATTLPGGVSASGDSPAVPAKTAKSGQARRSRSAYAKGNRSVARSSSKSDSKPASNKPDAIDELLRKMK